MTKSIRTNVVPTWCPGCFNFMILAGVQKFLEKQIASGFSKDDFAIVSGIGCHAKIFDYLDVYEDFNHWSSRNWEDLYFKKGRRNFKFGIFKYWRVC